MEYKKKPHRNYPLVMDVAACQTALGTSILIAFRRDTSKSVITTSHTEVSTISATLSMNFRYAFSVFWLRRQNIPGRAYQIEIGLCDLYLVIVFL